MTDVTTLLAPVKARAEKATEGPWETKEDSVYYLSVWHDQEVAFSIGRCADCGVEAEYAKEDAAFFAAARTDVPRLVAAIEAVAGLHKPVLPVDEPLLSMTICDECERLYPCPTITAVVAALGDER